MESDQKKNVIMAAVALLLLGGAALALFRDSIFSSRPVSTAESETAGAVNTAAAGANGAAPEPTPPVVPRGSGKLPQPH